MADELTKKHPMPALKDGGLLGGGPPALWGIVPMKTPVEQAREILKQKKVLKACREYRHAENGATGFERWPYFHLAYADGVVKFVEFVPSIPITVADALQARGLPEAVLSADVDFPDGDIHSVLILYFDAIWTTLMLAEQSPRMYRVAAETRLSRITYAEPLPASKRGARRAAWHGYGEYPASDATSG